MNENNNVNNQEPVNTQPEDNGVKGEKMFTQEEVNRIVSERLAKERSKIEEPKKAEEAQREAELTARENKLTCKEFLMENEYPSTLLDCLDTSDTEKFKKNAKTIYDSIANSPVKKFRATPRFVPSENQSNLSLEQAFSIGAKHKPKEY